MPNRTPAPRKLALSRETVRRLTAPPAEAAKARGGESELCMTYEVCPQTLAGTG